MLLQAPHSLCTFGEAFLKQSLDRHSLCCCSSLRPPAALLQTLDSLRTFKSAGIHCPSAYIITTLAMVFLELREQQAQREHVADKGEHLVNGLQRKASVIRTWQITA